MYSNKIVKTSEFGKSKARFETTDQKKTMYIIKQSILWKKRSYKMRKTPIWCKVGNLEIKLEIHCHNVWNNFKSVKFLSYKDSSFLNCYTPYWKWDTKTCIAKNVRKYVLTFISCLLIFLYKSKLRP